MKTSYIGDGAYVDFDEYGLELWTERDGERHFVYLEPPAWRRLGQFVADETTWDAGPRQALAAAEQRELAALAQLDEARALLRRRHGMECPTYDDATGTCVGCEVSEFLNEPPPGQTKP